MESVPEGRHVFLRHVVVERGGTRLSLQKTWEVGGRWVAGGTPRAQPLSAPSVSPSLLQSSLQHLGSIFPPRRFFNIALT